ncbi:MAG: pyridoxamine 5'-phosphate oxidase family protein [Proteobacteria bacterium]|nr:pyridoxamine 5'-phosphate oxidase family protein [Pseudomonadota bacterium]
MNTQPPPGEAFHAGERALQAEDGVREQLAMVGTRVIRDHMPQQHRDFFAQLPFLVLGSVDAEGQPWASVLAGPPGFVQAPDARALRVDALPAADDPLAAALSPGAPLGVLGIELPTRRRNRMNGTVSSLDAAGFTIAVQQSFGNCPRYIQTRTPVAMPAGTRPAGERLARLDDEAHRLIAGADTFFIATAHPAAGHGGSRDQGVDVSHRGGAPGFVLALGENELAVPDFDGNRFFNTLGNLLLQPAAGLLFIDFDRGDLLHVGVRGRIETEGAVMARMPPVERWLRFEVTGALRRRAALPLRWGPATLSPYLP